MTPPVWDAMGFVGRPCAMHGAETMPALRVGATQGEVSGHEGALEKPTAQNQSPGERIR